MSHADVEMPDGAIVMRLANMLREAQDLADLIVIRPHLQIVAGPWVQQAILGATQAHAVAESAAIADGGDVIHRARMLQDFVWTYGGGKFYPQDPKPEEVDLRAIAQSLSNKCRWNGHPNRFYSVGEHSLHVAEIAALLAERDPEVSVEEAVVYALIHDAGREAYLPDVPRPVANYLDASLAAMAEDCQATFRQAIEIAPPSAAVEGLVQRADNYALQMEFEALFPDAPDADAQGGEDPPLEVRKRFPVWVGAPPTNESIRDQWLSALKTALDALQIRKAAMATQEAGWKAAVAKVETAETCPVCAMEGKVALVEFDGLCAGCANA